jgi:hypothetical protein
MRRRLFCGECQCQDRRWVAALPAAAKSEVRAFPQELQYVLGSVCQGGHPHRHGSIARIFVLTETKRTSTVPTKNAKVWENTATDSSALRSATIIGRVIGIEKAGFARSNDLGHGRPL